jgi:hypothetical protein
LEYLFTWFDSVGGEKFNVAIKKINDFLDGVDL